MADRRVRSRFFSNGAFQERLESLIEAILVQDGAKLFGTRRPSARTSARVNGIELPEQLFKRLQALSGTPV